MACKFSEISQEKFVEFHRSFDGEGDWWQVCVRCGGQCENGKIGPLLPGEARYIASQSRISLNAFTRRYLDRIMIRWGKTDWVVDVLKLKPGCPFLDSEKRCSIRRCKVILCETYPIIFSASGLTFSLDKKCDLSFTKAAGYFREIGIPALEKLGVSSLWWEMVEILDEIVSDYPRLLKIRHRPLTVCETFTLEQIKGGGL